METRVYEREKLYKEVWAEPMTTLASRYGVSDVALRKHCVKLNIPLPKSGHWTRVRSGKDVSIPPLPDYNGPDTIEVPIQALNKKDEFGMNIPEILSFLSDQERQMVTQYCLSLKVPDKLSKPHDLIGKTKQYYSSNKRLVQSKRISVINLSKISDELKNRVYKFYNTLFKALEHLGYTITEESSKFYGIAQGVVLKEVSISLGEDCIPIFIKEIKNRIDHKPTDIELNSFWSPPTYDFIKTGKLHFGIDSYHAKRKNWRDTETKVIENQIGEIVLWIMDAIHVEKENRKVREAEKKQRLEERRIQEQIAERKEKELRQLELLDQYAQSWEKAERIRRFLDAVELKYTEFSTEEERQKINSWLKWARDKAGFLDPLANKDDNILGKGPWLFDYINKVD